jgi:Protein of unknown function (DUF2934)
MGASIPAHALTRLVMDTLEERIRRKAYELWEAAGQTGSPDDHWLAAERELQNMQDHSEATFEDVSTDRTLGSEVVPPSADLEDQKPNGIAET